MEPNSKTGMSHSEAGKLGWEKTKDICKQKLAELYQQRIEEYDSNPHKCDFCKCKIPYSKRYDKFCGQSCAAKSNNAKRYANLDTKCKRSGIQNCIFCKSKLTNKYSKYCSSQCMQDFHWEIAKKEIASDKVFNVTNLIKQKRYLREVAGCRCSICGATAWMGKEIPLILDHIDGNSENSRISNLRLICGNCDMQTSTYKGKNRGNGRFIRRKRYADGKSY